MNDRKASIGFVYNGQMPRARALVDSLIASLDMADLAWTSPADSVIERRRELSQTSVLVISGGDGTILRTVRVTAPYDVPILAINLGKVGFMSELDVDDAEAGIARYVSAEAQGAWIDERMMVRVRLTLTSGDPVPDADALNEVVLSRGQSARLLNVEASVDQAGLTVYRADGVMVSTASGSTATPWRPVDPS